MDGQSRSPGLLAVAGALSSAAALALVIGLFVYSFARALDGPPAQDRPAVASRARPETTVSARPAPWTTVRPNFQFFIFMLCEGETVRATIYDGVVYGESVTLRDTVDHELIVALLAGNETAFPPTARLLGSECMRLRFPSPKWS
ncbi:MAG: hypothetical protein AB7P33_17460 [Dehalococcoidia bacterium]